MRRYLYVYIGLLSLVFAQTLLAQTPLTPKESPEVLRTQPHLALPTHITWKKPHASISQTIQWLKQQYNLSAEEYDFQLISRGQDQRGQTYERYQQLYKGIPVDGSMYIFHKNKAGVYAGSGQYFLVPKGLHIPHVPEVSEKHALSVALDKIRAQTYKWQIESEVSHLQALRNHSSHSFEQSYFPDGELVILHNPSNKAHHSFKLAWKFDIYAHEPLGKTRIYIDAQQDTLLVKYELLHPHDSIGIANTRYSGERPITTIYEDGIFILGENTRGQGIRTWDMQDSTVFSLAQPIRDADNRWGYESDTIDRAATDAQWGAAKTHDFFLEKFGWNGLDGEGSPINCYVHYGKNFENAFWDGIRVVFGDGDNKPYTELDIVAHELAHGVTQYTSRLIYNGESGALNESFSDIMGKAVEYFARRETFSWKIGKARGLIIRDMKDPTIAGQPKNYEGKNWYTGQEDNGGVHINSGVHNHWFYLLVEGGTGINDFGEKYSVSALGMDTATALVYHNFTSYLTPQSTYEDARYFSIVSAIDLYGACSPVHKAVTNAWHAVGMGRPYTPNAEADFALSATTLCSPPYMLQLQEEAGNTAAYFWEFGDGTTSSEANPTHTYEVPGLYTIQLAVSGFCGDTDTLTKQDVLLIDEGPEKPIVTDAYLSCRDSTLLSAISSGRTRWFDAFGNILSSQDTLKTSRQNRDITYYAQNVEFSPSQRVGPIQDSIKGEGDYHNTEYNARIYFRVFTNLRLESVAVDAASAGKRTFVLEDRRGNIINSFTREIPKGKSRISLDIDLVPGTYRIGGSNMDLYRHESGATYPYEIPEVISLDGSPPDAGSGYYYYLYDWQLAAFCASPKTPVNVFVAPIEAPTVSDTGFCGAQSITLRAQHPSGNIKWMNLDNEYIGEGTLFTTPVLDTTTTYFVEAAIEEPALHVGPNHLIGEGGFHNTEFDARLEFEVYKPLRIQSVEVYAGSTGNRRIVLEDEVGNMIKALNVFVPEGTSRVQLNLDVQPGKYAIGGQFMDLYRNTEGAIYPYVVDSLMAITRSNTFTNEDFYYYFYDWEIVETPCYSPKVSVTVSVSNLLETAFSFRQDSGEVVFQAKAPKATSWYWDFGDGQTDSVANPIHSYADTGKYKVSLISQNETCMGNLTLPIQVSEDGVRRITTDLSKELFRSIVLYPNPGQGEFTVDAQFTQPLSGSIDLYNALGAHVSHTHFDPSSHLKQRISIPEFPDGVYWLRISTATQSYVQRYIKHR